MGSPGAQGRTAPSARRVSHGWAAADLADLLSCGRFQFGNEKQLQDVIGAMFQSRGIEHRREVEIGRGDIIDFLIGRVGLEIKVKQGLSQVTRQLHRYAQSDALDSLILATSTLRMTAGGMLPSTLNGKPLLTVSLFGSIF